MKRTIALLCALLLCLTGCRSEGPGQNAAVESAGPLVETAEPETAIEKIYENVTVRGLTDASDDDLTDKFFLDVSMLDSYWVRFSSGDFGLADVFILKPSEGMEPKVRDALEQVKLNRAKEFENYDVYDAHQIAQDLSLIHIFRVRARGVEDDDALFAAPVDGDVVDSRARPLSLIHI